MSLSSIVNAFPEAVGYLHTASQILSGATQADSSPSLGFEEVGATDVGAVFVVPIFDIAPAAVPPTDTLLGCDQLFLRMVSKNAVLPTGFDVVCAIVGGAVLAAAHIAEGQTGITLKGVTHLVVPRAWVLERAKADGLYTAAAGALTSGKEGVGGAILNPAQARGRDLDGRVWDTDDKRGAQTKLQKLMALTRLLPANKMEKFVYQLNFDAPLLQRTCLTLKASGDEHKDAAHPDAGLHLYSALQSLAVMKGGFGEGSKFQGALLLQFDSLDLSGISLIDFAGVAAANAARFDRDRYTPEARVALRCGREYVETFFQCFSHKDFEGSLQPLSSSLKLEAKLWNRWHDAFLLHKFSVMLQAFAEEVCRQKESVISPLTSLKDGAGCAALMRALASQTVADAKAGAHNWTEGGQVAFSNLDVGVFHEIKQRPHFDPDAKDSLKRKAGDPADLGKGGELAGAKAEGDKRPPPTPTTVPPTTGLGRAGLQCVFNMMNRLGVKDAAGKVITCGKTSALCEYKHTEQLKAITKATALKCTAVRSLDPLLAASFLKAVEARDEDSWALRERPPKQPRGKGGGGRGRGDQRAGSPTPT
mmetsp:Transcript_26079/g.58535  ORF Transcript_26079/g.58535 Transcript_26079/m.58535 type:complete len:590 (+) Transcript_26079:280-2049(+)